MTAALQRHRKRGRPGVVSTLGVLQQDVLSMFAPGPAAAIQLWKTLRALVPQTGHWPVVLGEDDLGSLGNLAAALWRAPSWFFWWD